jgi:N-acetylneuraminic acid mutarotase
MEVIVMKNISRLYLFILVWLASLLLASCGNGSSQSPPPPVFYSIGGTVTNLAAGDSVKLQNNGGDTLTVTANGAFTFATKLATGSAYSVAVSAQPSSPAQTCGVTSGSGTATANVTSVLVDCAHNEWTWMGGSDVPDQPGSYGTLGTAAPTNVPGGRTSSVAWTDPAGNFWLFGGRGLDSAGTPDLLNDLWKYSGGQWTWMSGSDIADQAGTYGTLGTPAPSNVPGARLGAVSWTDATGNLWLFGGRGYDSVGATGDLDDLWEYSGGQWTWVGGSNVAGQPGSYGTEGVPAPSNVPGARIGAVSWTDPAGSFWLFGGYGFDSAGTQGDLNDLWKYSGGQWTWMSGSNIANQAGTYGTLGTPAPGNVPGARVWAVDWTDAAGSLWLFGGYGLDSAGTDDLLNDLWKYSGGEWTWMSGSDVVDQLGSYGTKGVAAPSNVPAAKYLAVSWTDKTGNFWLFGGWGPLNAPNGYTTFPNDLWKYSAGQWTWMSGSDGSSTGEYGSCGTEGTAAPDNVPGTHTGGVSWTDQAGNLWLFGGMGYGCGGTGSGSGRLNQLWMYEP